MLKRLIEKFDSVEVLPVEIEEIRAAIISLGVQDRIILCADSEMDPTLLRGFFYRYRYRSVVYGDPENTTLIAYSSSETRAWQRVICCKEMIHIFDDEVEQTNTLDELDGLIKRLLGPLSSDHVSICDLMAARDRLALYQAIPLLFPLAARELALRAIATGSKTFEQIVEASCLPSELVRLVFMDEWPRLSSKLVGC
jgi:hypothetical protein